MSQLILKDGTVYEGRSFGANKSISGEVVFATGMVGYPESFTDPSYTGQILVLTYPLIGNYGVPKKEFWESSKIHLAGIIVCNYIDTPSHYASQKTLAKWLKEQGVPALEIKDTREIAQKLRDKGAMLGKIVTDRIGKKNEASEFFDPNLRNLVADVSTKKVISFGKGKKTVLLFDCGAKKNIIRELLKQEVKVVVVPWNFNLAKAKFKYHGILISNGPGDPKQADKTIDQIRIALKNKTPILGICLGNQILALAAGGNTYKLKFGHRGQNQPCLLVGTEKCYLTTQNHGFAVGKIPSGFKPWFINANDQTNEGIIHKSMPFMSVQFHPEATPGPTDTTWIFEKFIKQL